MTACFPDQRLVLFEYTVVIVQSPQFCSGKLCRRFVAVQVGDFCGRIQPDQFCADVEVKADIVDPGFSLQVPHGLQNRCRDLAGAEATITTNLLGPIRLTNALVDHLKAQADAAIVNVTSGLAFVPLVLAATYSATKAAIHSYTISLRDALEGQVEVIELAPPAVQTDLTPGQRTREGYQPLEEFGDEVFALFGQSPTPKEVLVERVKFLRNAEAEGRFDGALAAITQLAKGGGH